MVDVKPTSNLFQATLAAATISRLVTHPVIIYFYHFINKIDTLKICRQADIPFRNPYKAVCISLAMNIPALYTFFFAYETFLFQTIPMSWTEQHPFIAHMAASATAEIFSGLFWTPMEVIKSRMQTSLWPSYGYAMKEVIKNPKVLLRGYFVSLATFMPYTAINFPLFQTFKSDNFRDNLFVASASSALAAFITAPLETFKTNWQLHQQISLRLVRLMKGSLARVAWIVPSTAITLSVFEYFREKEI